MDKLPVDEQNKEAIPSYNEIELLTFGENRVIKMLEFFDEETRWMIVETSPSMGFGAVTQQYCDVKGRDTRLLCCDIGKKRFCFRGKSRNGNVVIISVYVTDEMQVFFTEKSYGKEVHMYRYGNNKMLIKYLDDVYLNKTVIFDLENGKEFSNEFDNISDLDEYSLFLKSYWVNGEIRAFIGIINTTDATVGEKVLDLNTKKIIQIPKDKDDLIDDDETKKMMESEEMVVGFNYASYSRMINKNDSDSICSILDELGLSKLTVYQNLLVKNNIQK